jgi:hypothetical protein
MNIANYTKIVNSPEYKDETMSLGFRRWSALPPKVRHNHFKAFHLRTRETNDFDYSVNFFGSMTEEEFKQYVITH